MIIETHYQPPAEAVYPNECHLCGWRQGDARGDDCPNAQCPLKSTPVANTPDAQLAQAVREGAVRCAGSLWSEVAT